MSQFQPFVMERMMSKFEQEVEFNLSESGVHPILLRDLLTDDPDLLQELLSTNLNYPHVNGTPELRQNIARMYTGATPENILVTVGAIEANYLTVQTLLSAGEEIVIMFPNYMQIWGLAKNMDLRVKTFRLREDRAWAPDLDELQSLVTPKTKMIAVCIPKNPTGRTLISDEMDAITAIAFVRYHLGINSSQLAERLRREKSVLIVPGAHFGMDHFLRISFGLPHPYLKEALDRIHTLITELNL